MALNIPSGLNRKFDIENWGYISTERILEIRNEEEHNIALDRNIYISGSDIDNDAVEIAKRNIRQAGIGDRINIYKKEINEVNLDEKEGCFIVNPPYGERLSDKKAAIKVYNDLGQLLKRHKGWSMAAISNEANFEKYFGRRATRKRRLFNARLECNVYIFENK